MKRPLAITAAAAMLALSLTGCGAERSDMDVTSGNAGTSGYSTTATDTVRNGTETNGSSGLGGVTGAVNRGTRNGTTQYGVNGSTYTATNNGGVMTGNYSNEAAVRRAARQGDRYARMLENARVHDSDGYLLDGENASYRTF